MAYYNRLSILLALATLGMVGLLFMPWPWIWLALGILGIGSGMGAVTLVRDTRELRRRGHRLVPAPWLLPGFIAVGASLLLLRLRWADIDSLWLALSLIGSVTLLALALLAENYLMAPQGRRAALAQLTAQVATYAAVFLFYAAVHIKAPPSGVASVEAWLITPNMGGVASVLMVGVLSAVAVYSLLRAVPLPTERIILYATITGLMLAQVTWGLGQLAVGAIAGSILLLLVFYFITSLIQHHLAQRLTKGVLVEYLLVAVLISALVIGSQAW